MGFNSGFKGLKVQHIRIPFVCTGGWKSSNYCINLYDLYHTHKKHVSHKLYVDKLLFRNMISFSH